MKNDNVNHPAHYNHDGIETIDVIKAWTKDLKPFDAYCMGNAIKYVSRWNDKGGIEDLKKARWYLNRVIGNYADTDAVPEWAQKMKDCLEKHAEQTNQMEESRWVKGSPELYEALAQKMKEPPQMKDDFDEHALDEYLKMMRNKINRDGYLFWNEEQWKQIRKTYGDLLRADYDFCMRSLRNCTPKEKNSETETLDKSAASKAFCKGELCIVFAADGNVSIVDKMLDCIMYLDANGYRREHLILELLGYLTTHPTAWKNKWNIVISLAGCRPDGKLIDICVAQDDFRDHPTINDKPYYIWPK